MQCRITAGVKRRQHYAWSKAPQPHLIQIFVHKGPAAAKTLVVWRKKTLQGGGAGGEESLPAWAEQWEAFLQGATCDILVLIAKEKHLPAFSHTLGAFQIKFDPS